MDTDAQYRPPWQLVFHCQLSTSRFWILFLHAGVPIYTQALHSLQQLAGTPLVPVIATSSGGLVHEDRLWGNPNILSHGLLAMGDSSGPQGESCLCGAGSPRGYWASLSCHSASE